ncbi:hypothetical protein RT99_16450 [Flavobacterium sp. MEB061]|jgi:hypothetical protein|uniref:hypothetical protein n=1 Tax=Flavobacterium sp. MEB061 TaxID=1587524 RepID=UPI0005AC7DFE|nr:hypothetical protein [Flavobacterium sp. MEB061]KIQ18625.1 hypothetical protein RT99_16450 [Flavobacterium sp. MEB061]
MKRVLKSPLSLIISDKIIYKSKGDNSKLGSLLLKEQKGFCAYTEHYIGFDDANDTEHFNPNLKDQLEDNYYNWYKVKHLPNQRKTNSWIEPILMPYADDFESRIIYDEGEYFARPNDDEANNLIILLDLNNQKRVEDRKNYIKRRRESINDRKLQTDIEIKKYFQDKIDNEINSICYLRAIQEEFKIDIWNMIPEL